MFDFKIETLPRVRDVNVVIDSSETHDRGEVLGLEKSWYCTCDNCSSVALPFMGIFCTAQYCRRSNRETARTPVLKNQDN